MGLLATVAELGTFLGDPDLDAGKASLVLLAVSAEAQQAAGTGGDTWDEVFAPDNVRGVVLAAAARLFTNPTGLQTERLGDYSYSRPAGVGLLTDAELLTCRRAGGSPSGTAMSVSLA